jgi:hypothetical protein
MDSYDPGKDPVPYPSGPGNEDVILTENILGHTIFMRGLQHIWCEWKTVNCLTLAGADE